MNFYMQYFHNFKTDRDTLRIVLQKRSKHNLVNKGIAECTLVLAHVLQGPLEEGSTLILHRYPLSLPPPCPPLPLSL